MSKLPKEMAKDLEKQGKKVIQFIIKQKYFDLILTGEKTQEFREIKPFNEKKMVQLDSEGYAKYDEAGNTLAIHYDAMLLYVGYNRERDSALVEIKDEYCELFVDEKGEAIEWQLENGDWWSAEQVVYNLGKVLCKDVHPKNK